MKRILTIKEQNRLKRLARQGQRLYTELFKGDLKDLTRDDYHNKLNLLEEINDQVADYLTLAHADITRLETMGNGEF